MKATEEKALETLQNEGVILYPTDTVWGIGCDATNKTTVRKIFDIKQRNESKSLVILVDSFEMLQQYVGKIPEVVVAFLKNTTKPTTVIFKKPIKLAANVIAADNTVAIRITNDSFCQKLIRKFKKPIVSTSANISGNDTPKTFKEIDSSILDAVDYVVNLRQNELSSQPSVIVKINEIGEIEIIRE